jgi:hypothetical protein
MDEAGRDAIRQRLRDLKTYLPLPSRLLATSG